MKTRQGDAAVPADGERPAPIPLWALGPIDPPPGPGPAGDVLALPATSRASAPTVAYPSETARTNQPEADAGAGALPCRHLVGRGQSFASFGEIAQGRRIDGEDFLITLPVDLWSRCIVAYEPIDGPSRVEADLCKSRQIAERLLRVLGRTRGVRLRIEIERDMPIGKGLSSSTADMLAVLRACQDLFGVRFSTSVISRLFTAIEPHDALHYATCVAYNHRHGRLLDRLDYIPDFRILAVDAGGEVCTAIYNRNLNFDDALIGDYEWLYRRSVQAFADRDDRAIADCAQRSTELHMRRTGNLFLARLLTLTQGTDVLGILTTHSGTYGGCLLPGDADEMLVRRLRAKLAAVGTLFETRTLPWPRRPATTSTGGCTGPSDVDSLSAIVTLPAGVERRARAAR